MRRASPVKAAASQCIARSLEMGSTDAIEIDPRPMSVLRSLEGTNRHPHKTLPIKSASIAVEGEGNTYLVLLARHLDERGGWIFGLRR
jgi:hypothetical protein